MKPRDAQPIVLHLITLMLAAWLVPDGAGAQMADGAGDVSYNPRPIDNLSSGVVYDITHEVPIEELNPDGILGYHYASFGKPDPFLPPLLTNKLERDTTLVDELTVLQSYSVNELAVAGIWKLTNGESKALIMTPKSEAVITKIGEKIGKKGGVVVDITPIAVIVREHSYAPDGTRIFTDTSMALGDYVVDSKSGQHDEETGVAKSSEGDSASNISGSKKLSAPSSLDLSSPMPVVGGSIPTK